MADSLCCQFLPVEEYDLDSTLASGQAFRWEGRRGGWESVVNECWVRLEAQPKGIVAEMMQDAPDWSWLAQYLQVHVHLASVIKTFPDDPPMRVAVQACRGLRLLRQEPWECLASFILSSTKQIVQIQEIVRLLCERFGKSVAVPAAHEPAFAFPTMQRIAACSESDLRCCKMGFRAPYLLGTAQMLTRGTVNLASLGTMSVAQARAELLKLPGVGRKIADCVLLFAYGFQEVFPVDVWVMKALRQLYFPRKRRATLRHLHEFSARHFGPHAGYAQQYLFHYMRTKRAVRDDPKLVKSSKSENPGSSIQSRRIHSAPRA
jgi:N-glycosylase/DNA lyase